MKALVKESAAPGFKLKDVAEPRIREDEVLIRVRRAGVCGWYFAAVVAVPQR